MSGWIGAVLKGGAGVTSSAPPPAQGPFLFLFEVDLQKRILRPVDTTALDRLLRTVGPTAPGGSTPSQFVEKPLLLSFLVAPPRRGVEESPFSWVLDAEGFLTSFGMTR